MSKFLKNICLQATLGNLIRCTIFRYIKATVSNLMYNPYTK